MKIPDNVAMFLGHQGFGIVSTLDEHGSINCAAKGIAGIDSLGRLLVVDLYRTTTFNNLIRNNTISFTSVDEHKFCGYTLKGKADIIEKKKIQARFIKNWQAYLLKRVSKRLIVNIKGEKKSYHHPEAILPKPEYLIAINISEIVNLTPHHLRLKSNGNCL